MALMLAFWLGVFAGLILALIGMLWLGKASREIDQAIEDCKDENER